MLALWSASTFYLTRQIHDLTVTPSDFTWGRGEKAGVTGNVGSSATFKVWAEFPASSRTLTGGPSFRPGVALAWGPAQLSKNIKKHRRRSQKFQN
jgi:hypothetical protein